MSAAAKYRPGKPLRLPCATCQRDSAIKGCGHDGLLHCPACLYRMDYPNGDRRQPVRMPTPLDTSKPMPGQLDIFGKVH